MEQILLKKNRFKYSELIEITIPAASTNLRFQFPDVQNLRNTKLRGLQIFTNSEVSKSILTGNSVITPTVIGKCYLTLMTYDGREVIKQLPVVNINGAGGFTTGNLTGLGLAEFGDLKINYPKSFIEFTENVSDKDDDLAVLFVAFYDQMSQKEMAADNTFKHKQ